MDEGVEPLGEEEEVAACLSGALGLRGFGEGACAGIVAAVQGGAGGVAQAVGGKGEEHRPREIGAAARALRGAPESGAAYGAFMRRFGSRHFPSTKKSRSLSALVLSSNAPESRASRESFSAS